MFRGFHEPSQNWSKLPHQLIDALPEVQTLGELKVILYILRHTWGYHDDEKRITLDEFEHGRKRRDGTRLDKGVGMSRPSIIKGLQLAEGHGFITVETDARDLARIKKTYRLSTEAQKRAEVRPYPSPPVPNADNGHASQPALLEDDPDQTTVFNGPLDNVFLESLKAEARADGKRGPRKWGSMAQKQQYRDAAQKIVASQGNEGLQHAIAEGLKRERKSRAALVAWLAAWANNINKPRSDSQYQSGGKPSGGPSLSQAQRQQWYGKGDS